MSDDARPAVLLVGPVMQEIVAETLAPRFALLTRDALTPQTAPTVAAIAGFGQVPIDADLMASLPALRVVSSFGVGYDAVDVAFAAAHGIVVTNTPDVLNDEVADLAIGLLLATLRRIPQADRFLRAGGWLGGPFPLTATLRGRRAGILGMGRIGKAIARRLEAFGVPVAYHSRRPQPDVANAYYPDPVALAQAVDILMVIVPGGPATRHLVNAQVLAALGKTGVLVNVARGSVVDETALIAALEAGTILGAGLDVFEAEPQVPAALTARDDVVLLPHVGSATHHTRNAMGRLVVDNVVAVLDGGAPLTPVPETPWPVPARGS